MGSIAFALRDFRHKVRSAKKTEFLHSLNVPTIPWMARLYVRYDEISHEFTYLCST
jgi:hypothetical protein